MISAGNDIVALKGDGVDRAGQAKFYSKIITQLEIDWYHSKKFTALSFESYVWLLWSVKEAVYKFQKRNNPALLFSPKKIIIQNVQLPLKQLAEKFCEVEFEQVSLDEKNCYTCKIHSGAGVFYSKSKVYDELVHTTVNHADNFNNIYWGIKNINGTDYETQSKNVRFFALHALSSFFPNHSLQITKSNIGYPILLKNSHPSNLPISFAHHENFVGYSFLLDKE